MADTKIQHLTFDTLDAGQLITLLGHLDELVEALDRLSGSPVCTVPDRKLPGVVENRPGLGDVFDELLSWSVTQRRRATDALKGSRAHGVIDTEDRAHTIISRMAQEGDELTDIAEVALRLQREMMRVWAEGRRS